MLWSPFRPVTLAVALGLVGVAAPRLAAQTTAPAAPAATMPAGFVKEFGTMWTFDAPPLEYWKARYGFAPDQAWLDHVRLASVRLPICSASFVSSRRPGDDQPSLRPGSASRQSLPPDTNYHRAGFAARTLADEKKCAGLTWISSSPSEDVTARVHGSDDGEWPRPAQMAQREAEIAGSRTSASSRPARCARSSRCTRAACTRCTATSASPTSGW